MYILYISILLFYQVISQHFNLILPVEDGDAVDPCIMATLRKLQDGYFAGSRSVSICNVGHHTTIMDYYRGVLK